MGNLSTSKTTPRRSLPSKSKTPTSSKKTQKAEFDVTDVQSAIVNRFLSTQKIASRRSLSQGTLKKEKNNRKSLPAGAKVNIKSKLDENAKISDDILQSTGSTSEKRT